MNTKNKEISLLNIQMYTTIIYVFSLIISIAITYDEKQKIQNKPRLFTEKNNNNISIFNRWLVLFLTLSYLYISYNNFNIANKKGQNSWPFRLQLFSSELSTIGAIIVLYVVLKTSGENYSIISNVENPNL